MNEQEAMKIVEKYGRNMVPGLRQPVYRELLKHALVEGHYGENARVEFTIAIDKQSAAAFIELVEAVKGSTKEDMKEGLSGLLLGGCIMCGKREVMIEIARQMHGGM